jgi:hypothetical protein
LVLLEKCFHASLEVVDIQKVHAVVLTSEPADRALDAQSVWGVCSAAFRFADLDRRSPIHRYELHGGSLNA